MRLALRRRLSLLFAGLLAACATAGPTVGERATPFTALDVAGKTVNLEAYRGVKHVVLVFYIGHT